MTKTQTIKDDKGSLGQSFKTIGAEHAWEGQELSVTSDPIEDKENRGDLILRNFYFKANPETLKRDKPTKQMIFNAHAQQISTMLWSDGLEPFEGLSPKIIISKKRDEYKIFVACLPRPGVAVAERKLTLQEIMNSKTHAT